MNVEEMNLFFNKTQKIVINEILKDLQNEIIINDDLSKEQAIEKAKMYFIKYIDSIKL